jgi:hypothetical protein
MKATPPEIERILIALDETPRRLTRSTARTDAAHLRLRPDARSWSAVDILSHLRACSDLWTHSIYAMLAEKEPLLADIDERKWAKAARYGEWDFAVLLSTFTQQRRELLLVLRGLPGEAWEQSALIAGRRHTVFTQARRLAKHESEHCAQMEQIV